MPDLTEKIRSAAAELRKGDPLDSPDRIERALADAVSSMDLTSWLGWTDGIEGALCAICASPTLGFRTFTFKVHPVVSVHRACMLSVLDEGSPDSFEEIRTRVQGGGPLFCEEEAK